MNMFFSIIIPAYNASSTIASSLRSLDAQSFKDYEVIVVDDGSVDNTYEIVQSMAASNSRIRVIRQRNCGPLIARQTAISSASGMYLIFLDSDDMLRKDALYVIHNAVINADEPDIVSYNYTRSEDFSSAEKSQLKAGIYVGSEYQRVKEKVCAGRFCNLWDKAVKRSCVDLNANYSSHTGFMHGEDFWQLLQIVDHSSSLLQLDQTLYFYRDTSGSSTSRFRMRQLEDIVQVNSALIACAQKWGGKCPYYAVIGETRQYVNLLKIVVRSASTTSCKEKEMREIREVMMNKGVFIRSSSAKLRSDDRLVLFLLERERYSLVINILMTVEKIKQIM